MNAPVTRRLQRQFLAACEAVTDGRLRLITPEGTRHDFGASGTEAELHLRDWSVASATATRGDIGFGEAHVAGLWDSPSIEHLARVALANFDALGPAGRPRPLQRLTLTALDRLRQVGARIGGQRRTAVRTDAGNEFFQLWLDPSMTLSSALFAADDEDLERAQARKHDRILDRLRGAERLLEIGCGWGAFAERAADRGRHVTGITRSPRQKGYADARLDGRAEIRLEDYRQTRGRFDGIVSIEWAESLGERLWPAYFATLRDRLSEGGRALIQVVTLPEGHPGTARRAPAAPGGHGLVRGKLLSDRAIAEQAQRAGLTVRDRFAFGAHYARTCRAWDQRLAAAETRARTLGYDDRFLRGWRFCLGTCAAGFATGRTDVVQVELAHA